jgi:phosphoadenosine phosphosulfate reductase
LTLVSVKKQPIFTTALIAGDAVILDALAKCDLLSKVPIVFVDTFTLFPETLLYLKEVEQHYGFQSVIYHAEGCADQSDYESKYGGTFSIEKLFLADMHNMKVGITG